MKHNQNLTEHEKHLQAIKSGFSARVSATGRRIWARFRDRMGNKKEREALQNAQARLAAIRLKFPDTWTRQRRRAAEREAAFSEVNASPATNGNLRAERRLIARNRLKIERAAKRAA